MRAYISAFSVILMLLCITDPLSAAFLKSNTTVKCLEGNCQNGIGKLEIYSCDSLWEKNGIYEGECRNGLPHGRGLIRDRYCNGGILIKGTWVNGKYHGMIEYSDFMERYTDNEIYRWKVRYDNDVPHGELTGFDRNGKLLARWQYDHGVLVRERYFYPVGREIKTAGYRPDYVDSVMAKADLILPRFRDFFTRGLRIPQENHQGTDGRRDHQPAAGDCQT